MFDKEFLFKTIKRIYDVDSPSGYTLEMMDLLETITNEIGYPLRRTNKGNGFVLIAGEKTNYTIGLSAHVDTLGLMVRSIASDGTLAVTNIGGPIYTYVRW